MDGNLVGVGVGGGYAVRRGRRGRRGRVDTRAVMRCVDDAQTYCSPGGIRTCTRKIYGSLLRGQTWHQMEGPGCGMAISVVFFYRGARPLFRRRDGHGTERRMGTSALQWTEST